MKSTGAFRRNSTISMAFFWKWEETTASASPTRRGWSFFGWSGILVEPYLPNFRRIAKTRTSRTLAVHAACVPFGFLEPNVSLIYSDLMSSSLGMESDVLDPKKHSEEGARWIRSRGRVREFKSPAKTLNSILNTQYSILNTQDCRCTCTNRFF